MIQKKWFHGTTRENWEKIKQSGFLNGGSENFLARNLAELERYIYSPAAWGDMRKIRGGLILTVKYKPNNVDDDYKPTWWEMIVRKSIPVSDLKVLKYL